MAIDLTVLNVPYSYPTDGQSPGWGEGATDWAVAVTEALNDLIAPTDITQTTFVIANNQTSFTDINGLNFNTGLVRSATINYSCYRISTSNPSGHAESGILDIVYDNSAASPKWLISGSGITGNSGITFNILDSGQLQYKSTDIGSAGYSGVLHFRAKTLAQ